MQAVNLAEKLAKIDAQWQPKVVAALNDYHVKLVKLEGEFVWHQHEETDELFLVLAGALRIRLREGDVELAAGELFVVPKGVEHLPVAAAEAHVLLIEPQGTPNTGDAGGARTAASDDWI